MAKPNEWQFTRDIVSGSWRFQADSQGGHTNDAIRAAAAIHIAQTLTSIERKLDNLGADGLHLLIRLGRNEHVRRENARKAKARAKARRTRARNKALKAA